MAGGGGGCNIAPRSMVHSFINMALGSIPRCCDVFFFLAIGDFTNLRNFDRLRFALRAHGLRRLLRRANYISAPCGWEQGAKWDHIRVGSGLGGIRGANKGLFSFPASFCFPLVFMGNIPRTFYFYTVEDSTAIDFLAASPWAPVFLPFFLYLEADTLK